MYPSIHLPIHAPFHSFIYPSFILYVNFQGYLGNCLSSQCGLSVICVERDAQRVDAANVRESKLVGSHGHHMTSVAISLDDSLESVSAITNLIDKVKSRYSF